MQEPKAKKAIGFFDGQNLYMHAKDAFGYHYPNYDPKKLFEAICAENGWTPHAVRFYTGVPSVTKDPFWHNFWTRKLLAMRRSGIMVESRPLRYRSTETILPDGSNQVTETPTEKGIDIRIALDIIRLALDDRFDVGVIFSQDQDLAEVVKEVVQISNSQKRWIRLASAYPAGTKASAGRGINGTDWIKIEKTLYDTCLDPRDYR